MLTKIPRNRLFISTVCLVLAAVFFIPADSKAEETKAGRVINYLPKDYSITTVAARGLHIKLEDTDFSGSDILKKRKACRKCNDLRRECPADTCLETDSSGHLVKKCSDTDCNPQRIPFRPSECSAIDVGDRCNPACGAGAFDCYEDGCPDFKPNDDSCKVDPSDASIWYCDGRTYEPRRFCTSNNPDDVETCRRTIDYYLNPTDADRSKCNNSPNFCYRYEPTPAFRQCVSRCKSDVQKWEKCVRDYHCCRDDLFTGNDAPCKESSCDKLLSSSSPCKRAPGEEECKNIEKQYVRWLLGLTDAEYRPIHTADGFPSGKKIEFAFPSRQGEGIGLIWTIDVEEITDPSKFSEDRPEVDPPQLFSLVRIMDPGGRVVATSSHHQRSFRGRCSIEAAAYFDEKEENGGLEPFKMYTAQVCYFIPMFDDDQRYADLAVWLKSVELKIYRAPRQDIKDISGE